MKEPAERPASIRPEGAGAKLWDWLSESVDGVEASAPLVAELCIVADRLEQVREKIAAQGVTVSGPRGRSTKNSLLDIELKLSGQFVKAWRTLGLSDKADAQSMFGGMA